ncbi:Zn-dependent protease [Desulfobacter hydrogenophilus]|uniref:Zn-dependent protease n=1 Tax=Desulfobacter hydrogenophilus TaxID=2291 RepID=A0A328FAA2_9BACT|nr:M48 family metallopeptidase [Desulfobacter hydrogenophilus]NDY73293.1 M48 family metalloprotease [Desulfobacter hydrogenophilus]QBH15276.1 Zn-dependent protease [Desulfobacter hydrogenophilus]RAM00620.1 Zn-dependent protease [Desulfobacter hydrogenophilus]
MRRFKQAISLIICIVLLFPGSTFAISIPDELKLGKEYLQQLKNKGVILHDPVAQKMIDIVGNAIVKPLPPQPFHFDFFMINDDSFNAFATPAANIFVHRGLIASLDNMDELAGILAHEIGHAVGRHVSQSIDRSKIVATGSLAGMLAGILVGAAAGSSEAGQALTIGSMAAGQSAMLTYTRENETEADQKAVLFLEKTGYSPKGILDSLLKIRQTDYQGIENIPDYFKTHPGTATRVSHLSGILADYKPPVNSPLPPKNFDYNMVKYRVIGLYGDTDTYIPKIEIALQNDPDNVAFHYGLGLLYGRDTRMNEGIEQLNKALAKDPFEPMILLELGRLYIRNTEYTRAITILDSMADDPLLGDWAILNRSVAQIQTGNLPAAQRGLEHVLGNSKPGFEEANYHMAEIMSRQSKQALSNYYLGVYYARIHDERNAARQLERALDTLDDEKMREKVEKELENLKRTGKKSAH